MVWTLGAIGPDAAEQSQGVIRRLLVYTANELIERNREATAPTPPGVRLVPFQPGSSEWVKAMGPINLASECIVTLGKFGQGAATAVPLLVNVLDQSEKIFGKDTARRVEIIQVLGLIDTPEAVKALEEMAMFNRDPILHRAAEDALQQCPGSSVSPIPQPPKKSESSGQQPQP